MLSQRWKSWSTTSTFRLTRKQKSLPLQWTQPTLGYCSSSSYSCNCRFSASRSTSSRITHTSPSVHKARALATSPYTSICQTSESYICIYIYIISNFRFGQDIPNSVLLLWMKLCLTFVWLWEYLSGRPVNSKRHVVPVLPPVQKTATPHLL